MIRSSHRRCSVKKGVLRNFAKFTGKHLCLRPATLLKKRLWRRCFPVIFEKFLRTPFLQNTSWRLLLGDIGILSKFCLSGHLWSVRIYRTDFVRELRDFQLICKHVCRICSWLIDFDSGVTGIETLSRGIMYSWKTSTATLSIVGLQYYKDLSNIQ